MRRTYLVLGGLLIGVVISAQTVAGAQDAEVSRDSVSVNAKVELTSKLVPSEFTLVLDPDPADPDAKVQILEHASGNRYRLDTAPGFGERMEIYLVTTSNYRVYKPMYGQTSSVPVGGGDVNFRVKPQRPQLTTRSLTFWKHQVNTYLKGSGEAEETREAMENGYPRRIQTEFPGRPLAGSDAQPLTLWSMHRIFTVAHKDDDLARARQQYLALLLNNVSGRIASEDEIADDGTTVGDAIRYLGVLISDDNKKNDDDAAELAARINDARTVQSGTVPQACLRPASARLDSGQEIRVFRHDGEVIQGRFSSLALDKELLTMTVATGDGERTLALPGSQIARIQYEEAGKVKAGAVIGGFLLGTVAGLIIGSQAVDENAGKGKFFYVPPEPFIGAGVGALLGIIGGAVISGLPDTRTIECEDGLARDPR